MKLRIRGNTLRLRITRSELARLAEGGALAEATSFPGDVRLGYELRAGADVARLGARFAGGVVSVELPLAATQAWAAADDQVEISGTLPVADGVLAILVEKDFPCATARPGEESGDTFERRGPPPAC